MGYDVVVECEELFCGEGADVVEVEFEGVWGGTDFAGGGWGGDVQG